MLKLNEMKIILTLNKELERWETERRMLIVRLKRIENEMSMIRIAKQAIMNEHDKLNENKNDS